MMAASNFPVESHLPVRIKLGFPIMSCLIGPERYWSPSWKLDSSIFPGPIEAIDYPAFLVPVLGIFQLEVTWNLGEPAMAISNLNPLTCSCFLVIAMILFNIVSKLGGVLLDL